MELNNSEKYTEKLAKFLIIAGFLFVIWKLCGYFSSVLAYILIAAVVSLIARPLMNLGKKIQIRKKSAPDWLLAIFSIILILAILCGLLAILVPVIGKVITRVTSLNAGESVSTISVYLATFNDLLIRTFSLKPDFRIEAAVLEQLKQLLDFGTVGNAIGSVATGVANVGIGLFSVVFISFFLIKNDRLFANMVTSMVPDRLEEDTSAAIKDVEHLLSRYFVGLIIEMFCVGVIDFLGLWAVARLDFESALGIGFMAGMLNIIPYVGPMIGGAIGTVLGLIIKYCSIGAVGLDVNFWVFVVILICIFVVAQLVDNFVLQPLIYSTSIKATPLEIFIVMLIAGTVGGIGGMLVAIPAYTVVRVVAGRFFPNVKIIRRLLRNE